eukprot:139528_1
MSISKDKDESWRRQGVKYGIGGFMKRTWIVGSYGLAAYMSYWYIHNKRKDLSFIQQKQFIAWPILYALRQPLQLFYIQNKRPVPMHEMLIYPFIGIVFLFPIYCAKAKQNSLKLKWTDYVGIGLTIIGHLFVIISEWQRKIFKSKAINKGKLY